MMGEPRRGRNCLLWVSSCHSTRTDSSPPERRYVPGGGRVGRVGGEEGGWRRMGERWGMEESGRVGSGGVRVGG